MAKKPIYIMVDVEADGPCPGLYSMIRFGAIVVEPSLNRTFDGFLAPIADNWLPEALAVSGFTRESTLSFETAPITMGRFNRWLNTIATAEQSDSYLRFVADNNGFDWQFINWYFWKYLGHNPFGYSSMNLNSLFNGMKGDLRASFKHLRRTKHDHNPVNDAKGNAEAMLVMLKDLKGH
jgi:Exonuclease